MNRSIAGVLAALCFAIPAVTASERDGREREWNFTVYLDDSEIGYHNFQLVEADGVQRVTTEADFRVKFLFFTAFEYEHVNEETWSDDCLRSIESRTVANGKEFEVSGRRDGQGFSVEATTGSNELAGCVKTFAYWNPDILDEKVLMNSQTGELLPVTVNPVAEDILNVRGEKMPATRYRLVAKNMELDVWYSRDRRWLALESTVKGGRKLRYELS